MSQKEYIEYMLNHKEEEKKLIGKGIFNTLYLQGLRAKRDKNGFVVSYEKSIKFTCPEKVKHLFSKEFNIPISDKCCFRLKKEPVKKWALDNNKIINLTGMRADEGGERQNIKNCIITDKDGIAKKFHPLLKVDNQWCDWFIEKYNIKLCELYLPPFNFKRTGCKGCPFSLDLQEQLDVMEKLLPNEKKHCEIIWKPVYDEYRRIGYRLKSEQQMTIDDFL